ncbi:Gp49 family protein [Bacillus sp. AFS017336]|uniref:Gp49 family protein n=1 Tax=Bacillus sp. AFS017336 TaxID=2033489 RepID=UPI00211D9A66|nr:Gp49 family protein [Bacillus sp. AFS017336]
MSNNTVTQEQVDKILEESTIEYQQFGNKTLVGVCTLPNGFILVEDASCVDPANFCKTIGKEIILERFTNKIWELEGYKLQDFVYQTHKAISESK